MSAKQNGGNDNRLTHKKSSVKHNENTVVRKKKKNLTEKTAMYGVLLGVALICGYIEFLLGFDIGVPGVKVGIANVVVLFLLYKVSLKSAIAINLLRILISSLLFGSVFSLIYGLAGSILAITVMTAAKQSSHITVIGVSVLGGVMHNVGQITAASIILGSAALYSYLPVLVASGVVFGMATGFIAKALIKALK